MIDLKWCEPQNPTTRKSYARFWITDVDIDKDEMKQIHEQCIAIIWGWA